MSTKRSKPTDAEVLAAARREEPEPEPAPANDNISKAEMVRQALAEGIEKPQEGVEFIKRRFGVDMARTLWSSYVAQARARERKASGDYQPRARGAMSVSAGIPASFGSDIKQIKGLIEQAGGPSELKDLANAIAALQQKYGASGFDSLIDAFAD